MRMNSRSPGKNDAGAGRVCLPCAALALLLLCFSSSAQSTEGDTSESHHNASVALRSGHWCNPGDAIQVIVYPDTAEFPNGLYHINGQGYAFFPIIGNVNVMNLTKQGLVDILKKAYIDYLRNPNNLQIRPAVRVSLTGGFATPGLYYVDPDYSLWDVIRIGGGTQREDGLKKLQWERQGEVFKEDLIPDLESGKSLYEIGFRSGDRIWVTHRPHRGGWEIFRTEILPVLTFSLSTVLTSITAYQLYQSIQEN